MAYDILLLTPHKDNSLNVCDMLTYYGMNVIQIEDTESMKAGLVSHRPAFVLLDFDTKGAGTLLCDLSRDYFHLSPFIIVSAAFANGAERAAMLLQGADACIDHPINPGEVLAVIKAVQRRERRIARLNLGRLLPCKVK